MTVILLFRQPLNPVREPPSSLSYSTVSDYCRSSPCLSLRSLPSCSSPSSTFSPRVCVRPRSSQRRTVRKKHSQSPSSLISFLFSSCCLRLSFCVSSKSVWILSKFKVVQTFWTRLAQFPSSFHIIYYSIFHLTHTPRVLLQWNPYSHYFFVVLVFFALISVLLSFSLFCLFSHFLDGCCSFRYMT